ncbi:hypothetical protein SAMN04489761_0180 [Tenacibaculum sp. MAR_2009_124]|uniref:hypothetical protein n=1 Tax=Tenacibaculum sp. MAR_2009_124 TaxID=1250059 RepID=UPI0008944B63|nr:hypothetical protein [Tenacibaculum sp. MAR_2009_124]SEB36661.1 hypothetical protein SAMN04489761_0180 [Tenacibaculum sp. MAR_2009_124]
MELKITVVIFFMLFKTAYGQIKTIHVFVALCDNQFQGIVPVPKKLGNGKDPKNNLYWGAAYGVKSFFKYKTTDWQFVKKINSSKSIVLEKLLFKHVSKNVYLLAEAYNGKYIKTCIEDFLKASNSQSNEILLYNNEKLGFGGDADLLAYIGHNGLMEFNMNISYREIGKKKNKEAIILACFSKDYFSSEIKRAGAIPLLWTTHLMAPEAYTLKSAIDGWILNETGEQIKERAARVYNKYQKCGIRGARNLFSTDF